MKYEFSVKAAAAEMIELPDGISEDQLLQELEAWVWDRVVCDMQEIRED
jgi:hypothetical protein